MNGGFSMTIVRDKAMDWRDDIGQICNHLRERGYMPMHFDRDKNYFTIKGVIDDSGYNV